LVFCSLVPKKEEKDFSGQIRGEQGGKVKKKKLARRILDPLLNDATFLVSSRSLFFYLSMFIFFFFSTN